jgi:phenylpyruvate tautomerase PptA (4-oxalocrotonate tautomerase family)
MPFVNVKTSDPIAPAQVEELSAELRYIVHDCLGKDEGWVMTGFEPSSCLRFRGRADHLAHVEVRVMGVPDPAATERMTARVTELLGRMLGIAPDGVYVTYFSTDLWGWNGTNF